MYRFVLVISLLPSSLLCQQLDMPRFSTRIDFEIPGDGEGYYLTTVGGIATLADGSIVVLQRRDEALKVFSSTTSSGARSSRITRSITAGRFVRPATRLRRHTTRRKRPRADCYARRRRSLSAPKRRSTPATLSPRKSGIKRSNGWRQDDNGRHRRRRTRRR